MPRRKTDRKIDWNDVVERIHRRAAEEKIESTNALTLMSDPSSDLFDAREALDRKLSPVINTLTETIRANFKRIFSDQVGFEINDHELKEAFRALQSRNNKKTASAPQRDRTTTRLDNGPLFPRSPFKRAVQTVLVRKPNASALEICMALDDQALPCEYKDALDYEAAYGNPALRNAIESRISQVRKAMQKRRMI
jgi:hypothetical protein